VRNGRQCLWRIYKCLAVPNLANQGLRVTFTVIDLAHIKLFGGNAGLEKFWNKWRKRVARIIEFVDEMRNVPLMAAYVSEYEEADVGTEKHTWEWLLDKGRASFQRERERGNYFQSLSVLKDIPRTIADGSEWEPAAPAVEVNNKGGKGKPEWTRPTPKGESEQTGEPQPLIPRRQAVIYADARRVANGVCWYFVSGACENTNCSKEHRLLVGEERKQIPDTFVNKHIIKSPTSGQDSDSSAIGQSPKGKVKGGGKGGKRDNPKIKGCRFIKNNKPCPRGDDCWFVWAHSLPPQGPPTE
jgi:hypothetical protein